ARARADAGGGDAAGTPLRPRDPPRGKRPRIHDARHTNASWLLGAGVPINYVQAHLGHESIPTTVDRYGHVMPAAGVAIRAAVSGALPASRPPLEGGPVSPSGAVGAEG